MVDDIFFFFFFFFSISQSRLVRGRYLRGMMIKGSRGRGGVIMSVNGWEGMRNGDRG